MPFGDATMIKCASCVQAHALQGAADKQAREAERASSRARLDAEIAADNARAEARAEARWEEARAAAARAAEARAARARAAAARAAEARAAEARAAEKALETPCAWCGTGKKHEAVVLRKRASRVARKLGDVSGFEEQVRFLKLYVNTHSWGTPSDSTYPYCTRKCRHEARTAGEHDERANEQLLSSIVEARQEAEKALKLVPKIREQAAAARRKAAAAERRKAKREAEARREAEAEAARREAEAARRWAEARREAEASREEASPEEAAAKRQAANLIKFCLLWLAIFIACGAFAGSEGFFETVPLGGGLIVLALFSLFLTVFVSVLLG